MSLKMQSCSASSMIAELQCPIMDQDPSSLAQLSPIEMFELFFDKDAITFFSQQTYRCALQKGAHRWNDVGIEEMRCFLGILLLSPQWVQPATKNVNVLGRST